MPDIEVYPGLVAACGKRYTDPSGRRYSPMMALALWQLARHLDVAGTGRVSREALKNAGLEMWNRDTFYRALRDAERLGLVRQTRRQRDGAELVACTGLAKVAALLELPNVGARKVSIPLSALERARTFRAALWAAWQAGRQRKTATPITRAKLRELSGMAESTQRTYEQAAQNDAGYRVTGATANAIILAENATPSHLQAARDLVHGGCYIEHHSRALVRPIGNTYTSSLPAGSRSRARKVNRLLSQTSCNTAAGQIVRRLFFVDAGKAQRTARTGRAVDVPLAVTGRRAGAAVLWAPVWDSWSLANLAGV